MSQEEISPELVHALQQRVNELEKRVERLENGSSSGGSRSGVGPRDQSVLNQLEDGDVVTVSGLKQLYQTHTDIRTKRTLKNRVKAITNRPEFTLLTPGKWEYTTGDDDE